MKTKIVLLALAGVAIVSLVTIGGTRAAMNASTKKDAQTGESVLQTNLLSISLEEDTAESKEIYLNQPMKLSYHITNDGDYDTYVRLVLHKTWGFESSYIEVTCEDSNWKVIDPSVNPETGEHYDGVEQDCIYVYYTGVVSAADKSQSYTSGGTVDCNLSVKVCGSETAMFQEGTSVDFEASVDAIQTVGASKAIPSEWGMYVVFEDDEKTIKSISTTPNTTITDEVVPTTAKE